MIPTSPKPLILYVISLDTILAGIIIWLQTLSHDLSNILSVLLSISGVIISYFTIINIMLKNKSAKLDNIIKEMQIKENDEHK